MTGQARIGALLVVMLLCLAVPPSSPAQEGKKVLDKVLAEPEPFSRSYLNPPELQYGCVGTSDKDEEQYAERLRDGDSAARLEAARLRDGDSAARLEAARALWKGHSRRYAADVVKYLAGPPPGGESFRALQREVDSGLRPEAVLRELTEGDYLWGTWLAFLRPHKDLVPALLAGLQTKPDDRAATVLALGNSGDARVFDPLVKLLAGKERVTAGYAALALGYLGDPKAEGELVQAVASDESWLQVKACGALAILGTPKALPALEKIANTRGYTGALNIRGAARDAIVYIERHHLPPDPHRWPAGAPASPVFTLRGHADYVWAVAFSPDGRVLASVGNDRAVRLWNPATGKGAATFAGHARQMTHVAFTDAGTVAAAGWGDDGSVRLLDIATGKVKATLQADDGGVDSLAVSGDGKLIAVTGSKSIEEQAVQVFDTSIGKRATIFPKADRALAFRPDGKVLATASAEVPEDILLWDLAAGKVVATLRGHSEGPMAAAFSPDGQMLASGGDWTLRVWDLRTGKQIASFRGDSDIDSVEFSRDGRWVVAAESGGPVRIWDVSAGKAIAVLKARGPVALSPDGKLLATGSQDGRAVLLWHTPGQDSLKR